MTPSRGQPDRISIWTHLIVWAISVLVMCMPQSGAGAQEQSDQTPPPDPKGNVNRRPIILNVKPIPAPPRTDATPDTKDHKGLEPPNDRDAESWLKRAKVAAEREDWKLAADTLERLIDKHGDRTVSLDEEHYYSALHLAREQIAQWPPEGLAVYRVLYDPEAKRLFERAKKSYDFHALREIARKYPLTTPGPEAIHLLATWLLDRRQPSEAIELLDRLTRLPHHTIPRWQILQKLTVAQTLADQRTRAASTLQKLIKLGDESGTKLPEDWQTRIETTRRFYEDVKLNSGAAASVLTVTVWPHSLGNASRGGRMAPIEPVITRDDDLSGPLPGAERLKKHTVQKVSLRKGRPPVWQAVSDGHRLFVTCPGGLLARDLSTFGFLWQAVPKYRPRNQEINRFRQAAGFGGWNPYYEAKNTTPRLDTLSTDTLFREYRGAVSTAFGLVFVIEQSGTKGEQLPSKQGVAPDNRGVGEEDLAEPNTLRAYETETGRAVWTKGRGSAPDDPLRHAHFKAVPIAVGSYLVAPCILGGDFALAVMNPDGTVVRKVLIGTGRSSLFPMNGTLQPTVHDGTIYVPTGAGQLSALSAYDFSLRWLTRYERERNLEPPIVGGRVWGGVPRGHAQPDEWLSSPPLIAGGLVLLAPHDSDQLLAFDRQDGTKRWAFPRGDHRLLIGTDNTRVVIAGRHVEAIDLATGRSVWTYDAVKPSGRAAICGEKVLVPTESGLVRLNLATGRPIGETQATDEAFGNLLAIDGSLYSIGIDRISKYPDPVQSRALAMARLEKNPQDVEAIIRLAWLIMLSEDWHGALSMLDRAESEMGDPPPLTLGPVDLPSIQAEKELLTRIGHLRVRALLKLATNSESEENRELYTKAVASARSPGDRVRAGLALCEFLADRGELLESFTRGLALLQQVGDQPVKLESKLKSRTDVVIGERLGRFWRSMNESDRAAATSFLNDQIDRIDSDAQRNLLVLMADCFGYLEIGPRLDLFLGKRALAKHQNESGIFFLTRAARRAPGGKIELEALLRLAMAYRFPAGADAADTDMPAAPTQAGAVLQRLSGAFSESGLPPGLTTIGGQKQLSRVKDFVSEMKSTLPAELFTDAMRIPRILRRNSRLALRSEDYVPGGMPADTVSFWDPARPGDVFAEVLPLSLSGQIRGLRIKHSDGHDYYWASDLSDAADSISTLSPSITLNARPAAVAGRVAALSTPSGVRAIGLTSGRMMWTPVEVDADPGALPDPPVVNVNGILIAAEDAGTLVAIPARDDARRIWRRHWPTQRLRLLRAVEGRLVVVDRNATHASILDPRSGRIRSIHRLLVGPPDPNAESEDFEAKDPDAHVALVGRVICRSGHKSVVGRDVITGRTLWTIVSVGLVKGLFELDSHYVGIAHGKNRFTVVRVDDGTVAKEITADGLTMPPGDAVLDYPGTAGPIEEGRVLLFTRTDDGPTEAVYVLASFPLGERSTPWKKELGRFATISRRMLRASPHYVAVVSNEVSTGEVHLAFGMRVPSLDTQTPARLVVVDKRTGMRMGDGRLAPYEFDEGHLGEARHTSRIIQDVIILNDRIIAIAPEGYFVLADRNELQQSE
ncbi:MAG: PQQ-binding-like beta-propeller repeat protein [Phycisphaerae bacterium]